MRGSSTTTCPVSERERMRRPKPCLKRMTARGRSLPGTGRHPWPHSGRCGLGQGAIGRLEGEAGDDHVAEGPGLARRPLARRKRRRRERCGRTAGAARGRCGREIWPCPSRDWTKRGMSRRRNSSSSRRATALSVAKPRRAQTPRRRSARRSAARGRRAGATRVLWGLGLSVDDEIDLRAVVRGCPSCMCGAFAPEPSHAMGERRFGGLGGFVFTHLAGREAAPVRITLCF